MHELDTGKEKSSQLIDKVAENRVKRLENTLQTEPQSSAPSLEILAQSTQAYAVTDLSNNVKTVLEVVKSCGNELNKIQTEQSDQMKAILELLTLGKERTCTKIKSK